MKVFFDTQESYYLAQFLPVASLLLNDQNHEVKFIFHQNEDNDLNHIKKVIDQSLISEHSIILKKAQVDDFYKLQKPNWIILGNTSISSEKYLNHSKTALMQHGIGPKSCTYSVSRIKTSVRFVEGQHRLNRLKSMFPDQKFIDTGFAKLDPYLNSNNSDGKTILYAPTFFPSSIELFPDNFPDLLKDYNFIIKLHSFSFRKDKYRDHVKKLKIWSQYSNVEIVDSYQINILPFMNKSDILISDASSVMFEFIALGKPLIWSNFYKLRWSYRGPLKYRLKRRMDTDQEFFRKISYECNSFKELNTGIQELMKNPNYKLEARKEIVNKLVGKVDGQCSERIVTYLKENL